MGKGEERRGEGGLLASQAEEGRERRGIIR